MILSEGSVNKTEYSEAWLRSYIRDTYPCVVQRIQPFDLCIQDPVAYEFFSGIPVMILIVELAIAFIVGVIWMFNYIANQASVEAAESTSTRNRDNLLDSLI